jgi:hypothetical protein
MQELIKQFTSLYPTLAGSLTGIRIGGRSRWLKPERSMWPMPVVLDVDAQHLLQMASSHDQQPVQALSADPAYPALREGIGVGRLDQC